MDYKSFLSDKISMPKYYDAETNGLGSINDDYADTVNEISNSYSGSTNSNPEKLTLEEYYKTLYDGKDKISQKKR